MADDPLVQIKRAELLKLVKKTAFPVDGYGQFREFEKLCGWSFSMGDAPASKRALAWKLLKLKKQDQELLLEWQRILPTMWISEVKDVDVLLDGLRNMVPARSSGGS